ncbi:MAG TPA: hypothetical protein VEL05_12250, partial [Candidatus Acidoferrum sp.]|nr:hypothetical protein [Candidatus Acidoferrum sp.]
MFALPGILGLIFIVYFRPQEILPDLQRLPLLYLSFALAVFGFAVDLRLRINKASAVPQLKWAILLFLWATLTVVLKAPENSVKTEVIEFAVSITLFFVIAHSVHTFRAFQMVAGLILGLVVTLSILGIHQRTADWGCLMLDMNFSGDDLTGTPDGRSCGPLRDGDCYLGEPEPGREYICERIGLFGTSSVEGRVRYRGKLQDP